jgi:putative endonuclease
MQSYVYIITNKKNGTLYIGVTSDLIKRVYEHKNKVILTSFSAKYNLDKLVYYEVSENIESAILREKQMKKWNRAWKIQLIDQDNPSWKDLYSDLL